MVKLAKGVSTANAIKNYFTDIFAQKMSNSTPSADTTNGSVGSSETWAKADHQHPLSSIYAISEHNHDGTYLKTLPSHNHDDRYYTETEIQTNYATKSYVQTQMQNIDLSNYYTKAQIDSMFGDSVNFING